MSKYLAVQGYKSCFVIMNPKIGGLGLCNKADCPIYKKTQCKKCDYIVRFHDADDRRIVKIALSMADLLFREYIVGNVGSRHYKQQQLHVQQKKFEGLRRRVDLGTRILMFKIILGIKSKYREGMITVDTLYPYDFAERLGALAELFLPVGRGKIKYKPEIYEK